MKIKFSKIHGCGNSFVLVREAELSADLDLPSFSSYACSPALGIGSDGLMIVGEPERVNGQLEVTVRMYNPDGSWMGMCGNGSRCCIRFLLENGFNLAAGEELTLVVSARRVVCSTQDGGKHVRVAMGKPSLDPFDLPVLSDTACLDYPLTVAGRRFQIYAVSMGNPHCVIFEAEPEYQHWGALIEKHAFFPERTNVEFVELCGEQRLKVRVWERGAGATLACGTGACAAVVAATIKKVVEPREVTVCLPGGDLQICWDQSEELVWLEGPTTFVCNGELKLV